MNNINYNNSNTETNNKPLLIINCTQKKSTLQTCKAIDMYEGDIFKVINANTKDKHITEIFNVMILSAKYGLVPANEYIENYDQKMPSRLTVAGRKDIALYANKHKDTARKHINNTDTDKLYVMLTKDYLMALDMMLPESSLERFTEQCISRDHRGCLQLKARLKEAILDNKFA